MGGGSKYPYPQWVWSPLGGWWPEHKKWKRNTALVAVGILLVSIPIARFGLANDKRVGGIDHLPSGKLARLLRVKPKSEF